MAKIELINYMTTHRERCVRSIGRGTEITIIGSALEEAETFLSSQDDRETAQRVDRIARLIEGFETPYGMEFLATIHWLATTKSSPISYEEVVRDVHDRSERKRELMKPSHIKVAYDRLVAEGWLATGR